MINKLRYVAQLVLLGFLFVGSYASAQGLIVGSKHDFTTGGGAQGAINSNEDQVCVFCHTPHGADTAAPVPLWNKVLTPGTAYGRYSVLATPSFQSEEAPVGSVSLACLSCHDGTQAMDVVLNSPGSGGYNSAGAQIDSTAFTSMQGTPVPNLGTDLSNDHPVSMQYGGGGALAGQPDGPLSSLSLGDPDFVGPVKATINGQPIWWVDSLGNNNQTREKTDMLLYTRTDLGEAQPFVECGSCHDPHNSDNAGGNQVSFLRTSNVNSQVCTACHVK